MFNTFKILTLNIGNSTTLAGFLSILRLEKPQIVMLQEVTLSSEQLEVNVAKYGYKAEANIDILNPTALGTGFVWQSNIPVSDVYNVVECRAQSLKLGPYNFLNIYAPSGSQHKQARRQFFGQEIFRLVRGFNSGSYPILGGDFNSVLSIKDTERNFADKNCPALKNLIENFNYSDGYRVMHPDGVDYTFYRPNCAASRLDRYYIPLNLLEHVRSVTHKASIGDHKYVCMNLSLPDLEIEPLPSVSSSPYWKLNTSILKDDDFLENFSVMYKKLQDKIQDFHDIADWWDHCAKPSIRKFCIGVSSLLADVRKNTKQYLFAYLNVVLRKGDWEEVVRVRQQLKEILQLETMGFVVRSRFNENAETEQASLFHANREYKKFSKNNHTKLKIDDEIVDNKDKIEAEVLKYFRALFNGHHNRDLIDTGSPFVADESELQDFLYGLGKLSPESQAKLAKDLTFEEVEHVIKHECEYNKSPGLDGLPSTWQLGQSLARTSTKFFRWRCPGSD